MNYTVFQKTEKGKKDALLPYHFQKIVVAVAEVGMETKHKLPLGAVHVKHIPEVVEEPGVFWLRANTESLSESHAARCQIVRPHIVIGWLLLEAFQSILRNTVKTRILAYQ